MSRYSELACLAVELVRTGASVPDAWQEAALHIFPTQPASRVKGCPRCAFLGLAEEGFIKGVPKGSYTNSRSNKTYALEALTILRKSPKLSDDPEKLWRRVMAGVDKQHNQQMNVVVGLWRNGDII